MPRPPGIDRRRGRLFRKIGYPFALLGMILIRVPQLWSGKLGCICLILLPLTLLGLVLLARGEALDRSTALVATSEDPRPPILYLRSFGVDESGALLSRLWRFWYYSGSDARLTDEDFLEKIVSKIGPFVALGRPGEKYMSTGAARDYVGEGWRKVVEEWVVKSKLVIVRVGDSPSLRREMSLLGNLKNPKETVFYLPEKKWSIFDLLARRRRRGRLAACQEATGFKFPSVEEVEASGCMFIWFTSFGEPVLLGTKSVGVIAALSLSPIRQVELENALSPVLCHFLGMEGVSYPSYSGKLKVHAFGTFWFGVVWSILFIVWTVYLAKVGSLWALPTTYSSLCGFRIMLTGLKPPTVAPREPKRG